MFVLLDSYNQVIHSAGLFEKEKLRHLQRYYKIRLTCSSLAIEGNSLTKSETERTIKENGWSCQGCWVYVYGVHWGARTGIRERNCAVI